MTQDARTQVGVAGSPAPEPRLGARRHLLRRIAGILAGFAGVGAVLGGLTGYWTTYRAVQTEIRAPVEPETVGTRLSIIVLPFLNLGGDARQDYFTDGITDSLTTDLSRALPGSFVVARDTAFTYKGQAVDLKRLRRELDVRYVLEGSVLLDGEQVRVNARLLDARTASGIWAERFDTARRDILLAQDEIVGRLSRAIGLQVTEVEARRRERERFRSPEAIDLVMRARAAANRPTTAASLVNARELFEQALTAQSDNVDALAGVASTYVFEVLNSYYPTGNDKRLETADTLLAQALAIDPGHLVALKAKAALLRAQGKLEDAIATAQAVVTENPGEPWAYKEIGLATMYLGRTTEALDWFAKAERLGPRDPGRWTWLSGRGQALILLGRDTEAIHALRAALDANPKGSDTYAFLAAAYALAGQPEAARIALASYERGWPGTRVMTFRSRTPVPLELTAPAYLQQRERLKEGLRQAGMPE